MSGHSADAELAAILAGNDQLAVVDDYLSRRAGIAASPKPKPDAPALKQNEPWTETEKAFARDVLQPALERGEYLWYMAQVTVYQVGQTYTFDFVALRPDGGADHYEVKGKNELGSESRASVKVRWTAANLGVAAGPHRVYWAKKQEDSTWKIREVKPKRAKHPILT